MKTSIAAAAALAGLAGATSAAAQDVTLAYSHWVPPTHALQTTGLEPWVESIEEASEGRIQIDLFPAAQLGAAADHYDMARDGIVDISFINPGYNSGRFPIISAGELPFIVNDEPAGSRALHEWYQQYAEQEMPEVKVCLVHTHGPGTLHTVAGPSAAPSDFAGKNIRPPHGTVARLISLMGASPVQVPAPEMREILSSGGADGTTSPWNSLITFGVDEVVTHHLDVALYTVPFVHVMNQASYDNLSPENQAVIDDHCTPEWSERISSGWIGIELGGREDIMGRENHTFYTPDEEQMAEWDALSDTLRAEWAEAASRAGLEDPEGALEDLQSRLSAVGGGFTP